MADHRDPPGQTADEGDDLLLHALHALPALALPGDRDTSIRTRATACFQETAARHQHRARRMAARLARPLLPLSIAGYALAYLIWAIHTAAAFLP